LACEWCDNETTISYRPFDIEAEGGNLVSDEDGFDAKDGFVDTDEADFFDEEQANKGLESDSTTEAPPTTTIPGTPGRETFDAFSGVSF
jgi:hypothetical protein